MELYRTKISDIDPSSPIRTVRLKDGRTIRKVVDKSIIKRGRKSDIRSYVQIFLLTITLWIGIDFYLFVSGLEKGVVTYRPPGVEGFLPISSLMSLRYYLLTGVLSHVHPAGFFILVAAIMVSMLMKKGFCSWICPVGFISESMHQLGNKIFGRSFRLPRFLDVALRPVKYLLLAFFLVTISMLSVSQLGQFLNSDYNKVADIKLYFFFVHISDFSLTVIGILIVLSVLYENFWCRYACPYGALLGLTSLFSPMKVRRIEESCIDCGKCAEVCPSLLPVDKLDQVNSAECTGCYSCVEACPIRDTLKFSVSSGSKGLSQRRYGILMLALFFGIIGLAMISGFWTTSITGREYLYLFRKIGALGHSF